MSTPGDDTISEAQALEQFQSGFSGTKPTETQADPIENTGEDAATTQEAVEPPVEYVQLTRQELDDLKAQAAAIGNQGDAGKELWHGIRQTGRPSKAVQAVLRRSGRNRHPAVRN